MRWIAEARKEFRTRSTLLRRVVKHIKVKWLYKNRSKPRQFMNRWRYI